MRRTELLLIITAERDGYYEGNRLESRYELRPVFQDPVVEIDVFELVRIVRIRGD